MTSKFKDFSRGKLRFRSPSVVDVQQIHQFALSLPRHDLLYLRRDISQRSVIEAWMKGISNGSIYSYLVEADGEMVGTSAIVLDKRSWSPHVGEVRVLVSEGSRRKGVGRQLIQETILLAVELGLEKIIAQMTIDQTSARMIFEESGFSAEALLKDHVRDLSGEKHDILILSCDIENSTNRMVSAR